jgi:hypothetical protein
LGKLSNHFNDVSEHPHVTYIPQQNPRSVEVAWGCLPSAGKTVLQQPVFSSEFSILEREMVLLLE